jgi:hypothetical protein
MNLTITDQIHRYEAKLAAYRRGLLRQDKEAFDDLFVAAYKHRVSESLSSHLLPFETFLLSGWLEDHKELMRLREMSHDVTRLRGEVERLRRELKKGKSEK